MYLKNLIALKAELKKLQDKKTVKSLLLFACDSDDINTDELKAVLTINSKPLLGGVFPEIIADGKRAKQGFCLVEIADKIDVISIDCNKDKNLNQVKTTENVESVLCFVNTLWVKKNQFINSLYNEFGPFVEYLGGGAGSLNFTSFPCVFANKEIIENGAVVGFMKKQIEVEHAHGWKPISGLIKVTETDGNDVISLNWKPAFSIYKEFLTKHARLQITKDNFFDIAKSYPLGLVSLDNEMIIRDPFATDENKISMVDEVPEGEYVKIMHGDLSSLLKGAEKVAHKLNSNLPNTDIRIGVDCISRVLFMEKDFDKELAIINDVIKCNGILSIGEIAKPKGSIITLFNKTLIVGQWKNNN